MKTVLLRQRLRQARRLPGWQREKRGKLLARNALRLPALKRAKRIACYLATPQEAPTDRLLSALEQMGKQLYVPIVRGQQMHFVRWQSGTPLRYGRFGICEPRRSRERIPATQLQLVFAPLLGYDLQGNRLGMGGGYYDRRFAFRHCGHKQPLLVGYAYSAQQCDALDVQDWDVAMDCLITDKRCYCQLPGKV